MKKYSVFIVILIGLSVYSMQAMDQPEPRIISLHPRFKRIVPETARVEQVAHGFSWVEGPVWNSKENSLLFSDVANNQILKWKRGNPVTIFLRPSGYTGKEPFPGNEPGSNGLTFDPHGRLILCQHGDRRIVRLERDGLTTTIVDQYKGKRLNSPNDVVFNSRGEMFFTDPPFGLPKTFQDPGKELEFQGIYRYSNSTLQLLDATLKGPNGIAFSPDEKQMYVSDPIQSAWFIFDVTGGRLMNKSMLLSAKPFSSNGPGGPDGIKVDRDGNLFTAGPGGLYVISPQGVVLGWFQFGVPVGNCAWGEDGSTLFITANTALYRVRSRTTGAGSVWNKRKGSGQREFSVR